MSRFSRFQYLTFLVLHDTAPAKTFRIPLSWMVRFGLLLFVLFFTWLIMLIFSLRIFFDQKKLLYSLNITESASWMRKNTTYQPDSLEEKDDQLEKIKNDFFPSLFPSIQPLCPPEEQLTFRLNDIQFSFQETALLIRFQIHYIQNDHKNQHGKIIIFIFSDDFLMTYPPDLLKIDPLESFFQWEKAEKFTVSKFREVKASFFLPVKMRKNVQSEIWILDKWGHFLQRKRLPLPTE